ncbi:hypothetical protein IJT10_03010 [bacterium]|nr:hypothetical protein [bacterium]
MRIFRGVFSFILCLFLLLSNSDVSAEEIFVRNKPLDRLVQMEGTLYAPMESYLQLLQIYWSVNEDGKVIFSKTPSKSTGLELKSPVFEAEFTSTVFAVRGLEYENEVWVPVYWLAQCLGFTIQQNSQTGIIDIIQPRSITYEDNLVAQQLQDEKEAKVREAEKILAKRRADKLATRQKKLEELRQAKATQSDASAKKEHKTERRKIAREGFYPSEFDEQPAPKANVSKPKTKVSAPKTEIKGTVPEAGKAEDRSPEQKKVDVKPRRAVLSYVAGPVQIDNINGKIKMQATIYNNSEADASGVVAHLTINDTNGDVALRKDISLGIVKSGEKRLVEVEDLYRVDMGKPQLVRSLNVKLDWQVFTP